MTKYRIRLRNGRVIGPFIKAQLFELKTKSHINGAEEAQVFPAGDWKPLKTFDFYEDLMDDNRTVLNSTPKEDLTFIIDLAQLRAQKNESEIDKINMTSNVPVQDLTETVRMVSVKPALDLELDQSVNNDEHAFELDFEINNERSESNKTLINPVAQQELEKIRRQEKTAKEEEKKKEENKQVKEEAEKQVVVLEEEQVSSQDSTRVFTMDLVAKEVISDALETELVLAKEVKAYRKRKDEIEDEEEEEAEDEKEESSSDLAKKRKKKIAFLIGAMALLYVIFFPDQSKPVNPPFKHLNPEILFPIPFDQADSQKAQVQINEANKRFATGNYKSIVEAGIYYKQAFENDIENPGALNMMVRAYAEELRYSKNKLKDANTLFNLIQSKRPFLVKDPNGVIGLNLFYSAINKHEAAADVVAKYLKLNATNVSQDLFAVYLQSLIKLGKIDISKQFYLALANNPDKNRYTLNALADYAILNEELNEAMLYLDEGIKKYPNLVNFYLRKSELLLKQKRYKEIEPLLKKAEDLNLEYNDHYRARFLQNTGILLAYLGNTKRATEFLTKSLKIEDSTDLRMRLADLSSINTKDETNKLISESKAVKFLVLAKDFFEKRNYELAFSNASKACDQFPGFIAGELFLAKVQLRLGLARQALNTLEALKEKHPDNKEVNLSLIDAYIETYKFNDAKNRIANISSIDEVKHSYEFASANARLYLKMGDQLLAISWLQNSISMNPLNDRDIFLLAEILIKRSNFEAAKALLNKCLELDPIEPDYRIAYSKIIYEVEDDQAAIGYLLGLLEEFNDNPKILSEIAIFYYRSGKVKDFQDFRARIEKLPSKDKSLYEFLIRAALLDERYSEIPPLVEQLLSIEPGELESMMTAGKVLFETGKLVEAAHWFKRIQEKLDSYPRVLYYIARIKYLSTDFDGALLELQNDIKANGDNDQSLALIAEIYVGKGNLVEAENYFKRAQKLNPKSYSALLGLADISTKRNNFDLALDLYKKAMVQKRDEPVTHKKVGDVYRLLGQGTLAIESYKMYLEMSPEATDRRQIESYIKLMQ